MAKPPSFPFQTASAAPSATGSHTILCFSHLRWDFVFQRPQHLMSRFARDARVIFWEEPVLVDGSDAPTLRMDRCPRSGVMVVKPQLPRKADRAGDGDAVRRLLDTCLQGEVGPFIRWYYTPMMLPFSQHVAADCVVYDCMDELANFKGAPPELLPLEQRLMAQADIVFTGGYSLYEAKKHRHPNIHPFPSSVDASHFALARGLGSEAGEGARLGFFGVVDERMDLDLLALLADVHPDWTLEIVGPVVKISEGDLPVRPNLRYLGGRRYEELPSVIARWDVALMPFAINDATRFISPTKTPEYLAAGKPVVSTPITDVIRHYGAIDGVFIAEAGAPFINACEGALALASGGDGWLRQADALLAQGSWDSSFAAIRGLVDQALTAGGHVHPVVSPNSWDAGPCDHYDVMVVGAGFAGAVMAERLASQDGKKVLVVDRRPHVAGNAYDCFDDAGILIHRYGPHIFHTNSAEIFDYLSRFTGWRAYEHRVLAAVGDMLVPMPINRTTLNMLYGLDLTTEDEAAAFLASRAEPVDLVRTSADVVISAIGRELYETFFQGYTRKQWGLDPSELDKSVTARVPTRTNVDDRYFGDRFQAMPAEGYTRMFERMLDHPNIDLLLGVDYCEAREAYPHAHLVFTGPVDEYFDYRFGRLPYRSLQFRHETIEQEQFQPVAVVNYPSPDTPYTRITEYKHLTGQQSPRTSISYEYPSAEGDPYYPIPRPECQALFKKYEALALAQRDVTFVGRLATYRYYNMDQVVGQALATHCRMAAKQAFGADKAIKDQSAMPTPASHAGRPGRQLTGTQLSG